MNKIEIDKLESGHFKAPEVEAQKYVIGKGCPRYTWTVTKGQKYPKGKGKHMKIPYMLTFRHSDLLSFNDKTYLFIRDGNAYRFRKRSVIRS